MGLIHEAAGPPPADELAAALPVLDDLGVSETVALSTAYAGVRRALLAVSGISLMQNLGLGSPSSLAGVVVTARTAVDDARGGLHRPLTSRRAALRHRAVLLAGACDLLEDQLAASSRDGRSEVPRRLLESVRTALAQASLVEAGMRQFTSVSCARYGASTGHSHDHDHSHDHH